MTTPLTRPRISPSRPEVVGEVAFEVLVVAGVCVGLVVVLALVELPSVMQTVRPVLI